MIMKTVPISMSIVISCAVKRDILFEFEGNSVKSFVGLLQGLTGYFRV